MSDIWKTRQALRLVFLGLGRELTCQSACKELSSISRTQEGKTKRSIAAWQCFNRDSQITLLGEFQNKRYSWKSAEEWHLRLSSAFHTHTHTCSHNPPCLCIHPHTCTCAHGYTHMCMCTHTHTCVHAPDWLSLTNNTLLMLRHKLMASTTKFPSAPAVCYNWHFPFVTLSCSASANIIKFQNLKRAPIKCCKLLLIILTIEGPWRTMSKL